MCCPPRSHHISKSASSAKPKSRIPTRRSGDADTLQSPKKAYASANNVSQSHSNTLNNRSSSNGHHNIRQSTSYGNLVAGSGGTDENDVDFMYRNGDLKNGNIIKRTKSFWKFGKSDDILEGMAMWKHRDLVQTENEKNQEKTRDATLKRRKSIEINNTISTNSSETLKNGSNNNNNNHDYVIQNGKAIDDSTKYHFTKSEIDHRISMQQQQQLQQHHQQAQPQHHAQVEDEDESIYDIQPKQRPVQQQNVISRNKMLRQSYVESVETDVQDVRRQSSGRTDKYRANRSDSKIPYGSTTNVVSTTTTTTATTTPKKKKKTMKPAEPIEYYDRETPDTISHGFDDSSLLMNDTAVHVRDTSFYDDESVDDMMMKTVKRQEILKQYYSSGTDTEQQSSSSDPYDCIVVEDHLVRRSGGGGGGGGVIVDKHSSKDAKMEFKTFRGGDRDDKDSGMESSRTGTLLPRTKLTKNSGQAAVNGGPAALQTSKSDKAKRSRDRAASDKQQQIQQQQQQMMQQHRSSDLDASVKSYGPWYDLWGKDITVQK